MKNYLLETSVMLNSNTLIFKLGKKQINTLLQFFLLVFLILMLNSNLNAQNVYKLTNNQEEMVALFANKSEVNYDKVHSLIFDLHPEIYIHDNTTVFSKKTAESIFLDDIKSFSELQKENNAFNSIKLIRINLTSSSDINQSIDLLTLKSFNNLKYVYILCYFDITKDEIKDFILNAKPEITIFYKKATEQ